MTAGKVKSGTVAASDSADTNFEVIGGHPLTDEAIVALAAFLLDLAESENGSGLCPNTFSKESANAI